MTSIGRHIARALVLASGITAGALGQQPPGAPVPKTFRRDIAPVLYDHCVVCHRPEQVAPMSLLTYEDAAKYARAIKTAVTTRAMPPWAADPQYGEFRNHPKPLTQPEIDAISRWVDGGTPEGDGAWPPLPPATDGWSRAMGRPPDRIIEAPSDIQVPATGELPTFTLWQKVPFRDDQFVQAIQLLPSDLHVIHHASLSIGSVPPGIKIGRAALWTDGPVLDGVPLAADGRPRPGMSSGEASASVYPLIFYVPGGGLLRFPDGIAKRIKTDTYFSWGFHLMPHGHPTHVKMRLGVWFAKKTVTHEAEMMTANIKVFVAGREIPRDRSGQRSFPNIPPGSDNWEITGQIDFPDAVTLYSLWPHMHYRGKDMTFVARYPSGRSEILLRVPQYNPNWQATYELVTPLKLPAGTSIRATAHYDNSANNRRNPNPDAEVIWGPQAENEMFLPFLEVSVDKNDLRYEGLPRLQ